MLKPSFRSVGGLGGGPESPKPHDGPDAEARDKLSQAAGSLHEEAAQFAKGAGDRIADLGCSAETQAPQMEQSARLAPHGKRRPEATEGLGLVVPGHELVDLALRVTVDDAGDDAGDVGLRIDVAAWPS